MNMHSPVFPHFQRMVDWLAHARGCKRRAHEYKRWALEDEAAGRTKRASYYHKQADQQWTWARGAIFNAKLERGLL